LVEVGACAVAPGGCVANVGVALKRLGTDVALCGKYGDDAMGSLLIDVLAREGLTMANPPTPGATTSSTIVLNPPAEDRMFLHCPGANEDFSETDVPDSVLEGAKMLHLGYPPLLRQLYSDSGQVKRLFERAHSFGLSTSLDMAMPDPTSDAAKTDWAQWLHDVLPVVDLFTAGLEELGTLLGLAYEGIGDIDSAATRLFNLGGRLLVFKLGSDGIVVSTPPEDGLETLHEPCFDAKVAGTTGAGDATVAGFLFARLRGDDLPEAARIATAVGGASVEGPDATSGIPSWPELEARLDAGWKKRK
jgi:sugar/nucleoside kinase (ribokinase family)